MYDDLNKGRGKIYIRRTIELSPMYEASPPFLREEIGLGHTWLPAHPQKGYIHFKGIWQRESFF